MTDASLGQGSGHRRPSLEFPIPNTQFVDTPAATSFPRRATATARVIIVSRLRLLRDGLSDALSRSGGISIGAAVGDTLRARAAILECEADLVLLDIEFPDSLDFVREIHDSPRRPRIVVFAVSDDEDAIVPYIEAGIDGYVARDGSLADVVATVECVGRGETIVSPKLAASLFQRLAANHRREAAAGAKGPELTVRERQILALVERGMANKEIARTLGIELATVKNHVHNLLEKLNVSRRGQAAARARGGM